MSQYPPDPQSYYPPQPQYQPPAPQPPKKKSYFPLVVIVLVALVLVVGELVAAGINKGNTTTTIVPTIQATSDTSSQAATPTVFTVGQQIDVGNWNVSVNSAKTSHGDEAFIPKSGTLYLVIDVTVINISTSNQLMASGYYFRLTDSTGLSYDEQFTDFGGPPEGTIIPNGKLRGQLIYEVPTSEHAFTLLVLGENAIDAPTAVWSITD